MVSRIGEWKDLLKAALAVAFCARTLFRHLLMKISKLVTYVRIGISSIFHVWGLSLIQ